MLIVVELEIRSLTRQFYISRSKLVVYNRSIGMLPHQGVQKIPQADKIYHDAKGKYVDKDEAS